MAGDAPFLSLPPGGAEPAACWWMQASDGTRLRAAHWRPETPKGFAVLLNGRTEFIEKTAVPAAELMARGFEVVSLDWRGQGLSDRAATPGLKGHVGEFAEFQLDLDALLASAPVAAADGPFILVAHSMGGAIGTAGLLRPEVRSRFQAAIFSAPMYGIAMGGAMRVAAKVTLAIGILLGKRKKWPPFGDVATPYVLTGDDPNTLTHDQAVWDWLVEVAKAHPALNLAMPTLGWFDAASTEMRRLAAAGPLDLPGICLLGGAEEIVDTDAVRRTAGRMGLELIEIASAKHEHLHEAPEYRTRAWAAIDTFLTAQGLPSA